MKLSSKLARVITTLTTLLVAVVSIVVLSPASPALAVGEIAVAITRQTPTPAESGAIVDYSLYIECTATNEPFCEDMQATIPLPNEVASATIGSSIYIAGASFVRGTGITIDLIDQISAGTSISVTIEMATENYTTPNGFAWSVPVTLSATGVTAVQAASDGEVTAKANVSVDKAIDSINQQAVPVDTDVTYTIRVCDPTRKADVPGQLGLESGTLVDTLPAGSQYVASSTDGVYDAGTHTVTWSLDQFHPNFCEVQPPDQPVFTVTVRYPSAQFGPASTPNVITQATNTAVVTAFPYGQATELTASDDVIHQFTDQPGDFGEFAKSSRTPTSSGGEWTTFDGNWLPDDGVQFEASWVISYMSGDADHGVQIRDRMPCSTPFAGPPEARSAHASPLTAESFCTQPSFILEQIRIESDPDANPAAAGFQAAIDAGWTPVWTSTTGTQGPFDRVPGTDFVFVTPAGVTVADVEFPFHASIIFPGSSGYSPEIILMSGHMIDDQPGDVFADDPGGAIVKNRADFQILSPLRVELGAGSDFAEIRVLPPTTVPALVKFVDEAGTVSLEASNAGSDPIEGAVLTDLLPRNVTFGALTSVTFGAGGHLPAAVAVETIDDYAGTGRQLVRLTLNDPYQIDPGASGVLKVVFSTVGLSQQEIPAGQIVNKAQIFVNSAAVDDIDFCGQGDGTRQPPSTNDPNDLDGNGVTQDDRFCEDDYVIEGRSTQVALNTRKLVKGNLDTVYQGFPAVGSVDAGGDGEFRLELTNLSNIDLKDAVVYDVLPRVGDTGVRTTAQRDSEFATALTQVPTVTAPSGAATIEYSTAAVPCRGEVRGMARDAWPASCDNTWVTAPADLSAVTAIRVTNLGDLPARPRDPNVTKPADVVITLTVSVPDSALTGEVAWNSFAVAASRTDNDEPVLPTEGPKVGLAVPQTDVELDKTVNEQQSVDVLEGSTVTYKITARHGTTIEFVDGRIVYTNPNGSAPSTALGVVVRDALPAGLTFVAGSASNCAQGQPQGTFDPVAGTWTVGDIRPGQQFDLCFNAVVRGTSPIRNFAEVIVAGPEDVDSTPGNMPPGGPTEDDEDTAIVTPHRPIITHRKVAGAVTANQDGSFTATYTVVVTNTGDWDGTYRLGDRPWFGEGATVTQISATSPLFPGTRTTTDEALTIVAGAGQLIRPNETHIFDIAVQFTVAPDMPIVNRRCSTLGQGRGAFNRAGLVTNNTPTAAEACLDIPAPAIAMQKTAGQVTANQDGSFDATYTIAVSNTGGAVGQYTLTDAPSFGTGATVTRMVVSNLPGGASNVVDDTDPVGPLTVVTNQLIDANVTHTYTVTVTFQVAPGMPSGERQCDTPNVPGEGAFNRATITTPDATTNSDACLDIPTPTFDITKAPANNPLELLGGFDFRANYVVTVSNTGQGPGAYTLVETPDFGTGATIFQVTLVNDPGDVDTPATYRFDITAPWSLTGSDTDVAIAPGSTHRYLVAVEFSIAPTMADAERDCGQQPQSGQGAYNQVQVRVGSIVTDTAETCIGIPTGEVLITKDVTSLKILDTDTMEIMYKIDVTNSSGAPVLYTLTDTFDFDQAITVARVSVEAYPPSVGLAAGFNRGFNGDDSDVIAALVTIEPNNMHTYTVTVTVDVDLAAAGGPDGDCVGTATGLKNDATVTFGNRTLTDSACRPFSTLELHKTVINDDGGEAEVEDFELSAVGAVSLIGTHGVRRIVPAGDYALSETGPAGYTASDWSCTGGNVTAASVTIVDPANVVCEIVNNDVPVDLELTKSDGGAVATAGGAPFQYTITVTNVGGRDVELDEPVTVTDDLPAELVWVEPAPAGCTVAGQTLTCDVDPALLTVGAQPVEIVATVRVLPGVTATSVVNRAWVTTDDDPVCSREPCTPAACPTPDGVTANADPTNNVDCEETPIVRDARIEIIKTDSVGDGMSVRPGDVFTYQLVVRNLGPSDLLPGVRVDDDLPAQLTLVSATSTDADWTCNAADPVVCTYANALGAGETAPPIVVTVRVAAAASGTSIRNVATARGEAGPNCPTPGAGNCVVTDDDDETTPLSPVADLAITKSTQTAPVAPNSPVRWDLRIVNNGPGVAVNVIISDTIPAPLTVIGVTSTDFSCTRNANVVQCTVASLAVGASGTVRIDTAVPVGTAAGTIRNVANVTSDTPDPNLSNNTDDAVVTVETPVSPPVVVPQSLPPTPPAQLPLPRTGSNITLQLLQAGLVMLLIGGLALVASRRRSTGGKATG